VRARQRLNEARSLVGSSDHGVSPSLYAKESELARRIPMPEEIDVAPPA
jgi:hypothetical protein